MNMSLGALSLIVPSLVLIAGVVDDLIARKVHNWLVLILILISCVNTFLLHGGFNGLKVGGLSMLVALACSLPLVLSKALGAGDMKLLMAFGISVDPSTVFWVLVYSFVWGAALGIFQVLFNKEGLSLIKNTFKILSGDKSLDKSTLHKIPYTVALFFGWLTQLSLTGFGGLVE